MEENVEAVTAMEIFLSCMVNHVVVIKALGITCLIMSITSKRMVRIDTLFELLVRLLQNHLQSNHIDDTFAYRHTFAWSTMTLPLSKFEYFISYVSINKATHWWCTQKFTFFSGMLDEQRITKPGNRVLSIIILA